MTKSFDEKIKKLKALEDEISLLEKKKSELRAEIFGVFEKESLSQYKLEGVAVISKVERKQIKFARTPEEIVSELQRKNLVKYLVNIPEQVIPARTALNKTFENDLKEGVFTMEGVSVETATTIATRFDK